MLSESSQPISSDQLDLVNVSRSEFINAMIHLYRGELGEATAWRTRIDTTTHWAVVLSATALTFSFSDSNSERQVVIPIVILFCTFLMTMEARRYRFFDIWRSRARMIEINFYRPMLNKTITPTQHWKEALAHDMEWPHFHMPWWEAVGRRLRRSYQWIYAILLGSWILELSSYPTPSRSFAEVVSRAWIGPLPGLLVMIAMSLFYIALTALGVYCYWYSHVKKSLPAGHPGRLSVSHIEEV
jgi:uncharacterized membrane protein